MLGFALTPDSMLSFQQAVFPLLIGCLIMVVGYPTPPPRVSGGLTEETLDSHVCCVSSSGSYTNSVRKGQLEKKRSPSFSIIPVGVSHSCSRLPLHGGSLAFSSHLISAISSFSWHSMRQIRMSCPFQSDTAGWTGCFRSPPPPILRALGC